MRLEELRLDRRSLPPPPRSVSRASTAAESSPAPSSGDPAVSRRYEPYPVPLVEELARLTRAREVGSPAQKAQNQQRITELANQLARNPVAGDVLVGARLVSRLGKGNYGTVWHATDVRTGEARAVKVFDTDRLGLGTSLYHFRRGVRAMRHLSATAARPATIVSLHEAEPSDLAFSMDYLDGKDLTYVAERGWALEKKLALMLSVCHAVEFAHANGVIHRDIKPANIVMRGGDPVLTDFDIADLLFAKTQSAQAAGTVNYSAPEALAGAGGGPSIDVFSLGRLLHFLLRESDPPLSFEDVPKLADIAQQQPALARIIRRCTLRDPAKRYSTVEALRIDLERQVHGSVKSHKALRPPRVATVAVVGVACAAALAGGAALYGGRLTAVAVKPDEAAAAKPDYPTPGEALLPAAAVVGNVREATPTRKRTEAGPSSGTAGRPKSPTRPHFADSASGHVSNLPASSPSQQPSALASPGAASPPSAAQPSPLEIAPAAFERGRALLERGDAEEALVEFERAYSVLPAYEVLYYVADANYQLQRWAKAREALERYRDLGATDLTPEQVEEVRKILAWLMERTASLSLSSNVAGAEVSIDGVRLESTKLSGLVLDKGDHVILVKKAGFQPLEQTISVTEGQTLHLVVQLIPDGEALR
jgi:eukaryotic-like serine/threonine-protein kinase